MTDNPNPVAVVPAGLWQDTARRRAAAIRGAQWHTQPDRATLLAGHYPLAAAARRSDGRWLLSIPGWRWRVTENPDTFSDVRVFATKAGAMLEADDILEAAGARSL